MKILQHKNSKIFINYFLGPLLFIWLSWSIYRQVQQQPDLEKAWQRIRESFSGATVWNLAAVVVLMIINWSLEAVKWKLSVAKIQQVGLLKAFKAVLSGVSFSVSTPNRMGEYLGRVLYMEEGKKLKTITVTIAGSISQLIITLLMGGAGLLLLRSAIESGQLISPMWMKVILYGVAAVLAVLLFIYFRLSLFGKWVHRLPGSKRFVYLTEGLEDLSNTLLLKLLFLSALRFLVFLVQYYLLFQLFGVDIAWWQCCLAVSVSFLVMAAIPTIAIAELAQRGKVMTTIMSLYTSNQLGVSFATAGIWLINLIIPAIIGSLLILSIKKMKTGEE